MGEGEEYITLYGRTQPQLVTEILSRFQSPPSVPSTRWPQDVRLGSAINGLRHNRHDPLASLGNGPERGATATIVRLDQRCEIDFRGKFPRAFITTDRTKL